MIKQSPTPFALRPIAFCVMAACCELAASNPTGPSVVAGAATFQNAAKTLTVTNTPGTIINWQGFSIGGGETTRFVQQSAASAVLNRVVGPDPSSLLGTLTSNGRVFLINTNGIIVGTGARIDTAGFIASTLNITDSDFLQGRLRFEGGGAGPLKNAGTIQASGDIMLVGPQIENTGIIRSENGAVLLAAGRKLTITSPDAQGVRFELQSPGDSALNVGTLDARTAAMMFAGTLRHSGDIRVGSASVDEKGRVTLVAQKDAIVDKTATITANGTRGGEVTVKSGELTWVEGSIEAKGTAGPGGTVQLLGEHVGLSGAKVDVSGETGGGTILVGGDYQGKNPEVPNAKATYVGADSTLKADAITAGDGGKVIVWADGVTRFDGAISARGGAASGDGGFVETSGHESLAVAYGRVDTRAPAGRMGNWLLDPQSLLISNAGALPPGNLIAFSDLVGMPSSVVAAAINVALTDVTLQANSSIRFSSAVNMTNPGVGLTAQAGLSIAIDSGAGITTNNGNVTLIANETTANGVIGADRLPGAANISMSPGATINAGNANVVLRIASGFGHDPTSGNITVANITAGNVVVDHSGPTANGQILRADATSMLTGSTSVFLQAATTGSGGSIGTSAEPIRVTTPALEALTPASAGGIFISGTGDLGIGGVPLAIYGGTVRGVQALAGGAVSITTTGNLTHVAGGPVSTVCGPGSNLGSTPICAVGAGNSVELMAASIGSAGGGRLEVQTSGAGVSAVSTSGGIFLQQVNGTLNVSNYSLSVPSAQPLELANLNGAISVDTSMSFATRPVTLFTGSGNTTFGAVTVDASSLTLSGLGSVRFDGGTATINAPVTIGKPVAIAGGTATFNNGGSLDAGVSLASGGLVVNGLNATTINGGTLAWSGGTIAGNGSLALGGSVTADLSGSGARVLNGPSLPIANMTLGGGSLEVQAGTLSLPGTVTMAPTSTLTLSGSGQIDAVGSALPRLVMNGGTLSRSVGGDLVITGDFAATGGGIAAGAGELVTQGNTTLGGVVFPQRNWRNAGTLDIVPGGRMSPSPGGGFQFTNASGATANLSTNLIAPFGAANEAVVTNAGILNVAAPGPDAMIIPNAFTNAVGANLNINSGALDLQDARTLAGNMSIPAGRTLLISSGAGAVFDGTAIAGTGTVQVRGVDGAMPQATFRGVSAANNALTVGANGTVILDTSPSTFGSVSTGAVVMPGDVAGAFTANTGVTINGALDVAGIATFNGASATAGSVNLSGSLRGSGAFAAPSLNWIGGSIQGAGVKTFNTVSSSDSLSTPHLAGNVALNVSAVPGSGTWTNTGPLLQDGAGQLAIGAGAAVDNQNLASWSVSSTLGNAISGAGTFTNSGTFSNAGATPHSVTAPFMNTGFVSVADGTALALGPGGATPDTGIISVGNGSIAFNGNRTLGATSTLSSSGGTIQVSGGTLNANGVINTSGPMVFSGGTANFSPGAPLTPTTMTVNGGTADLLRIASIGSTLAISSGRVNFREPATVGTTLTLSGGTLGGTGPVGVTGVTTWSGGGMDGSGTTTVNGGLAINGNATKSLAVDRVLAIPPSATATWSAGTITIASGATINNSGTWSDQTPGASMLNFGGVATFANNGAYNKTAPGVTTVGVTFNNAGAGSVDVLAGGLNLQGGGASSRPFNVTGSLQFASNYAVNAGSDVTGTGTVAFTGGTTTLSGGTYNVGATSASGGTANFNPGVNVAGIGALTVTTGQIALNTGALLPIVSPSLDLLGGTISGSDALTISGPTAWSNGTMSGTGITNANGNVTINGVAPKTLIGGRTLNVGNGTTWTGIGPISLGGGAVINNNGTWSDQSSNAAIGALAGGGTFNNAGSYTKSSSGTTLVGVTFNNSGGLNVNAGTLRLTSGGSGSGVYNANAGTAVGTLDLNGGTYTFNAGASVGGGGTLLFSGANVTMNGTLTMTGATTVSGGTVTFAPPSTVNNIGALTVSNGTLALNSGSAVAATSFALSGGTLDGADTLDVSGATTWTGGTMTGTGATNASGGLVLSGNGTTRTLSGGRTLNNNAGTATWTGTGGIALNNAGIANSGTWNDQSSGASITATGGGTGTLNNTGIYAKSVDTGTTSIGAGVAFNNTGGQVQVQNGTLRLSGGGTSTGVLSPDTNGTLEFNAATYNVTGGSVTGAGTMLFSGATVNIVGGTYNMSAGGGTTATGGATTFNAASTTANVGALAISGTGTVTLSSGEVVAASSLNIAPGGTLAGSDTVNVSGATTWTGGVMTGGGTTNANGGLVISGAATKDLDGGRILNNTATATWTNASTNGAGRIRTGNGARITNNGTWQDQTVGSAIDHSLGGAASTFTNNGSYVKSAAGTTAIQTGVAFDNAGSGQVQVQSGTLELGGGGTSVRPFDISAGAMLDFNAGSYTFDAGTSVAGAGTLRVSGATLNINTALTPGGDFALSGGTVNATSALTVNNAFSWSGGTITGAGAITTNGTTTVSGPVMLTDKTWENTGNVAVSGTGMITLGGAGAVPTAIENEPSGVFNVATASAAPITAAITGNNKRFSNEGRLDVAAGPAGALFNVAVTNTNAGTINANSGTVTLPRFAANDGTINIASGAIVSTGGNALSNNGTIGGAGTLNLGAGNTLTNLGTLRPGAATGDTTDTLTITGDLVQGASGRIDLEFGGTAARAFDALAVSGTATLGGTVNVSTVGGYTLAIGDAFPVISAGARVGNFSTVNKTFATNMTAAYGATSLTFTIGGGPVNSWISGSGDWSVGGNWSLGHVPDAAEIALLDQPGALTITIPAGTFTPSAMTSNENINIVAGTLSLANPSTINAAFGIDGGTLNGAGLLTVNGLTTVTGTSQIGGRLATTSFNQAGGSLTVNKDGVLNLTQAGAKTIQNTRLTNRGTLNIAGSDMALSNAALLENFGTLNLDGAARIAMSGAGATELANRSGGVINDRTSSATPVTGAAGTRFTNAGTFHKTASAAAIQSIDAAFDNANSVNVHAGTLRLTQGGADGGAYNLQGGTVLDLTSGTRAFNTGVAFTGPGTLRISGATVNVNTPLTQASGSPALELAAGTVNNAANIALNGAFTWSGGTIGGAGTLTTNAATTVSGTATLSNSSWTNFGPIALSGDGRIVLSSDGTRASVLDNRSGGVITDTTTSATPIGFAATRGMTRFDNSGRFVKAAGSAATQTLDVPMTNTRASLPRPEDGIAVDSGTLVANGLPSNAGTIDIGANATFSTAGLALTNTSTGLVTGNGTLDVGAASFTNAGIVVPGESPGTLTIAGNFIQTPTGRLEIDVNGPVQRVDYDLLKVTGNAALDGTLALIAPDTLAGGTSFQVITYATHTGDFAVKTAPPGVSFNATPGLTSYEVVRTAAGGGDTVLPPDFRPPPELAGNRERDLANPEARHRDPQDPRDPREQRRRVLPECR